MKNGRAGRNTHGRKKKLDTRAGSDSIRVSVVLVRTVREKTVYPRTTGKATGKKSVPRKMR